LALPDGKLARGTLFLPASFTSVRISEKRRIVERSSSGVGKPDVKLDAPPASAVDHKHQFSAESGRDRRAGTADESQS